MSNTSKDFKLEKLEADSSCDFCGTHVMAGFSSCPTCNALYGTRIVNYAKLEKKGKIAGQCVVLSAVVFLGTFLYCIGASKPDIGGYIACAISGGILFWSIKTIVYCLRHRKDRTEKKWWKFGEVA